MRGNNKTDFNRKKVVKRKGFVNSVINKLPIELHLPGYQYCGPGTKLDSRLARGDPGINPLDRACKEHDIVYSQKKAIDDRHIADKILATKAWERVKSKDADLNERANALLVSNIMNLKAKFGMGVKKEGKVKNKKSKTFPTFKHLVQKAKVAIKNGKPTTAKESMKLALQAAKKECKNNKQHLRAPRVIPVPKTGGILPLIPIFAGLSALGALTGGASDIAKAVIAANDAKKQLKETTRHNETMEAIAMGRGLYLKPHKTGLGLYLNPNQKN